MTHRKVYGLGILIALASIANFVGVFTPCWLSGTTERLQECAGIVPYYSTEKAWLAISSWLMFITVAFTLTAIFAYFIVQARVLHSGFCCGCRKWFILISIIALLISIMTAAAVILLAINFKKYDDSGLEITLGYSAWISVASGAIFLGVCCLSGYIAHREC
ncbi:Protein CBG04700 [Caenorhabditis briggsae]|uniref:Protein CBG04700 n=1 Tax=Caenorhabditis briggsae TaxID=6238 RepID=A8WY95_CAEBR|nr:Protein CBG04700 [Caenorhabditis briggsae]CAP25353.1 Protein CBG04700 [Caenorhabditis briggsae]